MSKQGIETLYETWKLLEVVVEQIELDVTITVEGWHSWCQQWDWSGGREGTSLESSSPKGWYLASQVHLLSSKPSRLHLSAQLMSFLLTHSQLLLFSAAFDKDWPLVGGRAAPHPHFLQQTGCNCHFSGWSSCDQLSLQQESDVASCDTADESTSHFSKNSFSCFFSSCMISLHISMHPRWAGKWGRRGWNREDWDLPTDNEKQHSHAAMPKSVFFFFPPSWSFDLCS